MKTSLSLLCIFAFIGTSFGEITEVKCRFGLPIISKQGANHKISLGDCDLLAKTGEPAVPYKKISVLLPKGAKNISLVPQASNYQPYDGIYSIAPAQPLPLGIYRATKWHQNERIYNSAALYPDNSAEIIAVGSQAGFKVVDIFVYPVRFIPANKQLLLTKEISFSVSWDCGPAVNGSQVSSAASVAAANAVNPEMLTVSKPVLRKKAATLAVTKCTFYIITNSTLSASFKQLADWKTKKGIYTKIVTTSEIYNSYNGKDNQEKIRNFIIAKQKEDAEYILLGGDHTIIPSRHVYQGKLEVEPPEPELAKPISDLYYADCNGTWDADGDGVYGERASDEVDLYPDIIVTRAPVETSSECAAFVEKVLTYEKSSNQNHVPHMMLTSVNERGEEAKANAIAGFLPPGWTNVKLYESTNTFNSTKWKEEFQKGCGYSYLIGHGFPEEIIFSNRDQLKISNVDALNNSGMYPVMSAVNCMIGSFDNDDCIVEHFMYRNKGGAVAFMANSRLGSPAEGGTHKLNADLYRAIFEKKLKTLGQAYTYTKTNNAANAKTNNELSYCFYEMNMFGDPTMLLWTAKPKILSVTATDPFSETSGVRVKVTDGGSAVDSALVCLMWKDDSVIETVGYTGSDGVIDLDITHKSGYDSLWLTITKQNYLPVEKCLYYDETTSSLSHLTSNKGYVWQIHSKRQFDVISSNKVSSHARRIGVRIFDMTGRVIHQSKHILNAGERTITFDRKKAVRAAGACIIEIRAKNETVAMRHFM